MNDFIEKLVSLRSDVGRGAKKAGRAIANTAKGTLANMSPGAVEDRYRAMDESRRSRNEELINENFGNVENYLNTIPDEGTQERAEYDELFTPVYVKMLRKLLGK